VTTEYDARHEYLAEDFFRAYARTKLLAEKHIHAGAKTSQSVIFRPTAHSR
jgi:nucleoside-diphosphate-sugar epimerase